MEVDMKLLSPREVHAAKVAELGLPATMNLTSVEAIAAAIRRAAGIHCPCSVQTLLRAVIDPMRGLAGPLESLKSTTERTIEALVSHGDLLEHRDVSTDSLPETSSLLYIAPLGFIERQSQTIILRGIPPDPRSTLPNDLQSRIEFIGHLRLLTPHPGEDLSDELGQLGLAEIDWKDWARAPDFSTAEALVERYDDELSSAPPSGEIPGLILLDSDFPVNYYPGRWRSPLHHSGRYVARREQAYGADLWCYVELHKGRSTRLLDLPLKGGKWRGCDDAWHLQMAIDSTHQNPQLFRVQNRGHLEVDIEFYSPAPMWARRRWSVIGKPVTKPKCLFAFTIPEPERLEEVQFLRTFLWLQEAA